MPPKKLTVYQARAQNYAYNYDLRQVFKTFHPELQLRYQRAGLLLPEIGLNLWGSPMVDDRTEQIMINLAIQNNLEDAWFLIPFYQSEGGWDSYVLQFNDLPEDENHPKLTFSADVVLSTGRCG